MEKTFNPLVAPMLKNILILINNTKKNRKGNSGDVCLKRVRISSGLN